MDVLNDDLKIEILSFAKHEEIEQYSMLNKEFFRLCNSDQLWNKMIAYTFPFYPDGLPNAKKTYYKLHRFVDKYTLDIIAKFLELRAKSVSLTKCYNTIFYLLVKYISGRDHELEIEDKKEQRQYHDKLIILIFNDIFVSLSVPVMVIDADLKDIYPLESFYRYNKPVVKYCKQLGEILYDMIMTRIDQF